MSAPLVASTDSPPVTSSAGTGSVAHHGGDQEASGRRGGRCRIGLLALALILIAMCAVRLTIERPLGGSISFGWPSGIVLSLRMTAIVTAGAVGAALAISGTMLQALMRNPLADPFILGVSSGAGVGVMAVLLVAARLGADAVPTWVAGGGVVLPAAVGGLTALTIVQALGLRRGGPDPLALILAGVVVSAICGAIVMLMQHLVPHGVRGDLAVWMMGRIPESTDRWLLSTVVIVTLVGLTLGVRLGRAMDAATFGDDEAHSVGVSLARLRLLLATVAGLLAAASVAIAGPIGFVGLIAPHVTRLIIGGRHGPLVLGAALCGAALLIGADCLRQLIDLGGGRMPVGIFTALAGGPLFLWLLRTGRGRS